MEADLLVFLRTARLGQLRWGLRMEDVTRLLGPPPEYGTGPTNRFWIYGSLEIAEYQGAIEGISLYYRRTGKRPGLTLPDGMELAGAGISHRTTLPLFRTMIVREGISFEEKSFRPVEDSVRITMGQAPSAVEAWFVGSANRLSLISFFRESSQPK